MAVALVVPRAAEARLQRRLEREHLVPGIGRGRDPEAVAHEGLGLPESFEAPSISVDEDQAALLPLALDP